MRFRDLEEVRHGQRTKFRAQIDDQHELVVSGPPELLEEMLQEAQFDIRMDASGNPDPWSQDVEVIRSQHRSTYSELARLDDIDALFKDPPLPASPRSSVVAAIRATGGHGTPFFISVSGLVVPTAASMFFHGCWVSACTAMAVPFVGDQDLILRLFSPTGPPIAASALPGLSPETVLLALPPPFLFLPVVQLAAPVGGICGQLTFTGV
jgi:hypothetical protein